MIAVLNPHHRKLLRQQGYFVTDLLLPEQVELLRGVYERHFENPGSDFYATSFHPDIALKKEVNREVLTVLSPALHGQFGDVKVMGTAYLEKPSGVKEDFVLHQDWTVCDEEEHGAFTVWIALEDMGRQNGAMRVIPGSHKALTALRAPSLPVAFEKVLPAFTKYLIDVPLKAGQALVFNQRLAHASYANPSPKARLALTVGLTTPQARLFMLYYNGKGKLDRYDMPDDMMLYYPEIIDKPHIGTLRDSFPYKVRPVSEALFQEGLYRNRLEGDAQLPLFRSPEHQEDFSSQGYIRLPALDSGQVASLRQLWEDLGFENASGYGFYVGMDNKDKAAVKRMMEGISDIVLPVIEPYLADFKLFTASFVVKDPDPLGVVPPHQDWTFVEDEVQHCSVTCWIPLVDVTMDNGCMGVIKGSHRFFGSVRPSPSPQVPSPLNRHMFTIFPYLHLLEMKAGEALIFDNRTIHASPPNITGEPRLAVGLGFTQAGAEVRHFYLKPGTKDTLLKYAIEPGFFMQYDNSSLSALYDRGGRIEGWPVLGEAPFIWEDLSKSAMKERIVAAGNTYNDALTRRMARLFSAQMKSGVKDKVFSLAHRIKDKLTSAISGR